MSVAASPEAVAAFNAGVRRMHGTSDGEALEAFAAAARLDPQWAEPHYAAGHVEFRQGRFAAAAASFRAALARAPDHLAANVDLANALVRQQRYTEAVPLLARARSLAPANESIWWTLRGVLLLLRRDEDALADFQAFASHAGPLRSARVRVAALVSARRLADPAGEARALEDTLHETFADAEPGLVAEALALLQYHDVPGAAFLALYERYDERMRTATGDARVVLSQPAPGRLRVGYLSADFREHVMGELLEPVLAAHDRQRFHVTLFSLAPTANADAVTARFRAAADDFVELAALGDAEAAEAIAASRLHLLVDLMGHSAFARPGILARKPAPTIATHLGYHGAMGLASIDFKVTDPVADLPDGAGALREHLLALDLCVLPLRPYAPPPRRYARADLRIADDAVVIAAFVGVAKLSLRCVAAWKRVLERVPRAVLLLSPLSADEHAALLRRLTGLGIDPRRIVSVPYERAFRDARHALSDMVLDTFPYTGGDTTATALAAGVPVVTRRGSRHAERVGASILVHAGLADLVADDDDAFVALACRIAEDRTLRLSLRARVIAAFSDPALSDPSRYAAALERAWRRAIDGAA